MSGYLIHIGNKNSGRYPRGSGENPHQHDGIAVRKSREYREKLRDEAGLTEKSRKRTKAAYKKIGKNPGQRVWRTIRNKTPEARKYHELVNRQFNKEIENYDKYEAHKAEVKGKLRAKELKAKHVAKDARTKLGKNIFSRFINQFKNTPVSEAYKKAWTKYEKAADNRSEYDWKIGRGNLYVDDIHDVKLRY